MQDIRAITLDLDDTLWPIEPVIRRAEDRLWQHLVETHPRIAKTFSPEDVHGIRTAVMEEFSNHWHDFRFLRKKVLERIATESGYGTEIVEPAFDVFDRARNEVELFPDVMSPLTGIAQKYRLVALTNGNANLEVIGIRKLFHDVVTSSEVGVSKPDQRIFEVAVARTGYRRDQVLHVGDHPATDIDGARRAGLRTAWMNRVNAEWPSDLQQPDAIVTTFLELKRLLSPARSRC